MKRFALLTATVFTLLIAARGHGEDHGSLVIIGGALRYSQTDVWSRIVELAGGPNARIAVFPTASSEPLKYGSRTVDALRAVRADAFLVPLYIEKNEAGFKRQATDPELVEQLKTAGGVFFTGGSQERITAALGSTAGDRTPLLDAIWDVYRRGGVVAGTSAGAAVMSHSMFRESRGTIKTLQDGLQLGKELAPGLGFLDAAWFVEQHCIARGRFARSLVAMRTLGLNYGVGIDENTAVVVQGDRAMSVLGYKGAIVLDLSQATSDPRSKGFNVKNAKLSYLDVGDAFDLQTRQLTPSEQKRAGQAIDPSSASFEPARGGKLVVGDILGNTTLVDVLGKLIDSREPEAIGLAFDADEARAGPTQGFEFRFFRAADSRGWFTSASGASAYTVSNIHLDIRPVQIAGPLYK
jgi:cyanophycinase